MKKIDKLVLQAFLGPFFLTFLVVVFILLSVNMLKYFDDIIGKGLGWDVIGQLFFYFAVFTTPSALPLAVLLSSLIAFGNLGEHFELTAIKAAGISLTRAIAPLFVVVIFLTIGAFYINNTLVPKAALEAYSLLYDIKQKKPALDLREGTFYNGIGDVSIKVNKKYPDQISLKEVIVYDHRQADGNRDVTVADSGRMYTILNERYLKFELFNGYNYREGGTGIDDRQTNNPTLSRTRFSRTHVVYDLSSFGLIRTDQKLFEGNRMMRNMTELESDIDSVKFEMMNQKLLHYQYRPTFFNYYLFGDTVKLTPELEQFKKVRDSIRTAEIAKANSNPAANLELKSDDGSAIKQRPTRIRRLEDAPVSTRLGAPMAKAVVTNDSVLNVKLDSLVALPVERIVIDGALNMARQVKTQIENTNITTHNSMREFLGFRIQWHKILASSLACFAMFLIGAPLGAIIKKGGLGMPVLVSIVFFILYYVISMQGEKLAKTGAVPVEVGVWAADFILIVIGLICLRQARKDARLFEADNYQVLFYKAYRFLMSIQGN